MAELLYDEESTAASFSELLNFLLWCDKGLKVKPFIVGGWAVYAYAGKQKSLDVDVVFRESNEMEKAMKGFFKESGFSQEELFDQQKHFVKIIKTKTNTAEVRFDYYCFEDENKLFEDSAVKIPWRLLEKNSTTKQINGLTMNVPIAELLLVFKVKAYRDRTAFLDVRGIRIDPAIRARTKSKLLKDAVDIKDLLNACEINKSKLKELLEQTNFTKYFDSTMKEIKQK